MTHRLKFTKTLILAALLAVPGIAAAEGTAEPESPGTSAFGDYTPKGFLSDYSKLTPVEGGQARLPVWEEIRDRPLR